MTIKNESSNNAARVAHIVDLDTLLDHGEALVDEIVSTSLTSSIFRQAFTTGLDDIASLLRSVPIFEGRLLERGIALIARSNPDLVVLTDNLRLPVTKAATELVARNDEGRIAALSLDCDSGGRKSYTPDLLIVNRSSHVAHLIDIKRSLGSYEVSRIAELKSRMLAAALVVPDLLYKEHRRLHVDEVRVVILNAQNQRTDIEGGVWPLTQLDHLLGVAGAGEVMMRLRELFRERVEENWSVARPPHSVDIRAVNPAAPAGRAGNVGPSAGDAHAGPERLRAPVSIGFARLPKKPAG
ncbi:hypothetical protein M0654_18090 [Rhizobium sp. NTR19]|uniref:Uncharacterized protein n=1 Tax=Neorhizobium turbinariae TaxID=2937795 RepID=A0ABT0IVL5_9HYPH|nr:hypothetical protein [Neorhizobium turbinariae]MCK8781895.1 hypothetical protein [Neorhizobium turbinariae]